MSWFILRITKGDALAAERVIKNEGFEPYCPKETFFRAHRRDPTNTKREQHKALFPGYLFVEADPDLAERHRFVTLNLTKVLGTKIKGHLMSFNSKHLFALDRDIDRCRAVEDKIRDEAIAARTVKSFTAGDIVTILRGVLAGALGTVISARKRNLFVMLDGKANNSSIFVDVSMVK